MKISLAISNAAFLSLLYVASGNAIAASPEVQVVECYENGETIFTSDVADIPEFDAEAYNVTLLSTFSIPEKTL